MKAIALRKQLGDGLTVVGRNVSQQAPMPLMKHILIEAKADNTIRLVASDDIRTTEYGLEAKVEVPGRLAVEGRQVQEIVGSMREGDVMLVSSVAGQPTPGEGFHLLVGTTGSTYQVNGADPDGFPDAVPLSEDATEIEVSESDLKGLFHLVAFGASTSDARPILTAVLLRAFKEEGKDTLLAAATDTHRLPVAQAAARAIKGGPPVVNILVPRPTATELDRVLEASSDASVIVRADAKQVQFVAGMLRITSRVVEGEYPMFEKVLPKGHEVRLLLNRAALGDALKRVSIVARKSVMGGAILVITKEHSLVAKAKAADAGSAREEIDAVREGKAEMRVPFNAAYLADAINVLKTENIYLRIADANEKRTAVIEPVQGEKYVCVVMSQQQLGWEDDQDAEDFTLF
jgi:DNA polymerase-3 subunit beta